MANIIKVNNDLSAELCSEGYSLNKYWDYLVHQHAEPKEILAAMRSYFAHKSECKNCRFVKPKTENDRDVSIA